MSKNLTAEDKEAINKQIEHLEKLKIEIKSKIDEINSINKLANNNKEGWAAQKAAEAYDLMIRIYETINRNNLTPQDNQKLNYLLQSFDKNNSSGLIHDAVQSTTLGIQPTSNLVETSKKQLDASKWVREDQSIPYFKDNEVMLSVGHKKHSIIVKYWRQGFDENNNPVSDDKQPHIYKYYRTEYNAGDSTKKRVRDLAMTVSTTEILPYEFNDNNPIAPYNGDPYNNNYYNAMKTTIKNLIIADKVVSESIKPKNARLYRTLLGDEVLQRLKIAI